jgi:hypothetical protein
VRRQAVPYTRIVTAEPTLTSLPNDIRDEAVRLASAISSSGLRVKLMGGLAVWLLSQTIRSGPYARAFGDVDVVAASRDRKAVGAFLERIGYIPDRLFNALHGAQRLVYTSAHGRWSLDVIFDELNMSHRIDLRDRLNGSEPTLDPADLLMTKLQVWQVNEKDLGDAACLLADHRLAVAASARDETVIDLARLRDLVGSDWGLCHTAQGNLARVAELWNRRPVGHVPFEVGRQVEMLLGEIDAAPKSIPWRARARVGERVRWYETPEDVRK